MSEVISLTIPNTPVALAAAIQFFAALEGAAPYGGSVVVYPTHPEAAQTAPGIDPATGDDVRVDTKGVAFDEQFCGNAAEPFYSTGPRAGQWKKRKGVDDAAYDKWYEERLQDLAPAGVVQERGEDDDTGPAVNTGAAFGNQQQAAPAPSTPQTAGDLMGWISGKQAAQLLSQDQITAAYKTAGITVPDLFDQDQAKVAVRVTTLYQILSAQVGA